LLAITYELNAVSPIQGPYSAPMGEEPGWSLANQRSDRFFSTSFTENWTLPRQAIENFPSLRVVIQPIALPRLIT